MLSAFQLDENFFSFFSIFLSSFPFHVLIETTIARLFPGDDDDDARFFSFLSIAILFAAVCVFIMVHVNYDINKFYELEYYWRISYTIIIQQKKKNNEYEYKFIIACIPTFSKIDCLWMDGCLGWKITRDILSD